MRGILYSLSFIPLISPLSSKNSSVIPNSATEYVFFSLHAGSSLAQNLPACSRQRPATKASLFLTFLYFLPSALSAFLIITCLPYSSAPSIFVNGAHKVSSYVYTHHFPISLLFYRQFAPAFPICPRHSFIPSWGAAACHLDRLFFLSHCAEALVRVDCLAFSPPPCSLPH